MLLSEAVKLRIDQLSKEKNIKNPYRLTTLSGIGYSTLVNFKTGKSKSIQLDTLLYICEGLNIELKDFFNDPVFTEVENDTKSE